MLYLLIVVIGGVLSLFGPWWIIGPVCFVLCWMFPRRGSQAFWLSALAGMTVWLGYSVYLHSLSGGRLTDGVTGIFTAGIPALSGVPGLLVVLPVAALVVGPVSGFSGLAGLKLRQLIRRPHG